MIKIRLRLCSPVVQVDSGGCLGPTVNNQSVVAVLVEPVAATVLLLFGRKILSEMLSSGNRLLLVCGSVASVGS